MPCCQLSDRKVIVSFLVFAQIMIIAFFGNMYLNFTSPSYFPGKGYKKLNKINTRVNNTHLKPKNIEDNLKEKPAIIHSVPPENSKTVNEEDKVKEKSTITHPVHIQHASPKQRKVPEVSDLYLKIKDNVVFRHLKTTKREKRESVNFLLLVSSAPKRTDRRNAIRETWWSLCKSTEKVTIKCLFITDQQSSDSKYARQIKDETEKYHDLEFQDLGGGVEFGKRYLYHMLWAVRNFEFDYFLRLDDDYFICLDKVINELPMPPLKMFHWGWVHCINGITRPEESVLLLSKDVIEMFLLQNPETMRCHPWADQQLGLWVEDLGIKQKLPYRHDNRLHHHPPARNEPNLLAEKDICKGRIGLHGSYPETMRTLWKNRGTYDLKRETLVQNSNICKSDLNFQWGAFGGVWRYEPKLCKTNPTWDTSKQGGGTSYGGREEGQGK